MRRYPVLSGHATFTLDGETFDAPVGTVVFVRDPHVRRHARAEEPDTAVLAVGGPRSAGLRAFTWEDVFAAERHRASEDYDAMVADIASGLERHPDFPAGHSQTRGS